MSKWKMSLLISVTIPAILLAGCTTDKDVVIKPDKEPSQIVQVDEREPVKLSVVEVSDLYAEDKSLLDYTEELAELGYPESYKEILLEQEQDYGDGHGHGFTKKGLVYEVEDGFAMIEYDADTDDVLAITGYQNEQELILQEMKTKAFAKESEQIAEQDETKKAELQKEVDAMWAEIGELETHPE